MRLLLDTQVLLNLADEKLERIPPAIRAAILSADNSSFQSVASLWEVAIKHRLGKLPLPCPLDEWPIVLQKLEVGIIDVLREHVLAEVTPWPDTRDPFDRLLLAVAQAEDMRLVTLDEKLLDHPLAWRPA